MSPYRKAIFGVGVLAGLGSLAWTSAEHTVSPEAPPPPQAWADHQHPSMVLAHQTGIQSLAELWHRVPR